MPVPKASNFLSFSLLEWNFASTVPTVAERFLLNFAFHRSLLSRKTQKKVVSALFTALHPIFIYSFWYRCPHFLPPSPCNGLARKRFLSRPLPPPPLFLFALQLWQWQCPICSFFIFCQLFFSLEKTEVSAENLKVKGEG